MLNRFVMTITGGGVVGSALAFATKSSHCKLHLGQGPIGPKWDSNWDHRAPKITDGNKNQAAQPTAVRHIIMVRHGQYNFKANDIDCVLTKLGREQAELAGKRLKEILNNRTTRIVNSTMTRAKETADLVCEHLPGPREEDSLIREGAPIQPDPPHSSWKPEDWEFFQEGAVMEAGFRKYFHRADPSQEQDSYEILVCHGNVIRYCFTRALQLAPESWLRHSVAHGSITWLAIYPDGEVASFCLGDVGYMPHSKMSS